MKTQLLLTLPVLLLGCGLAWASPVQGVEQDLFLRSHSTWLQDDWYGIDINDNGVIDANEWRKARTQGELVPWGKHDLFLRSDAKWTQNDWYGVDINDNGVIDANEWRKIRSHGTVPPWGRRQKTEQKR